jgi:hypothetical protein
MTLRRLTIGQLQATKVDALVSAYFAAHAVVVSGGFVAEIEWQRKANPEHMTETELLRESAWVILSAGLSVRAVTAVFPALSSAFCNWSCAEQIVANAATCRTRALRAFNHRPKVNAVLSIARAVFERSFEVFRSEIALDPIPCLSKFAYLGPATSRHLAKNLGFPVSKPDRHLIRFAAAVGLSDPAELCEIISRESGDAIGVVDLVLWRYATLVRSPADVFQRLMGMHTLRRT